MFFYVHLYKIDFFEVQRIQRYLIDRLTFFVVVVDSVEAGIAMMNLHLC